MHRGKPELRLSWGFQRGWQWRSTELNSEITTAVNDNTDRSRIHRCVPKLELGEPAYKRAELVRRLGGQDRGIIAPAVDELLDLGIDLGRQEGDKQVEDVDAEPVGDDVEALHEEPDPEDIHESHDAQGRPPPQHKRRRLVKEVLVPPPSRGTPFRQERDPPTSPQRPVAATQRIHGAAIFLFLPLPVPPLSLRSPPPPPPAW